MTNLSVKSRSKLLKDRSLRCVCKYCGGELRLRNVMITEDDDARSELFCEGCNRIEFGIEPEIYQSAKYFVEEGKYCYADDLNDSRKAQEVSIAKVCEILTWGMKNLNFLSNEGFLTVVKLQANLYEGCELFTNVDLKN